MTTAVECKERAGAAWGLGQFEEAIEGYSQALQLAAAASASAR
jgi:hypothetical protein